MEVVPDRPCGAPAARLDLEAVEAVDSLFLMEDSPRREEGGEAGAACWALDEAFESRSIVNRRGNGADHLGHGSEELLPSTPMPTTMREWKRVVHLSRQKR